MTHSQEIREMSKLPGCLVIVGGHEDKDGEAAILREFIRLAGGARARIAVLTAATELPEESGEEYRHVFKKLGAREVCVVGTASREDAQDPQAVLAIETATGAFFTGGDQLRITSLLGGTPLEECLHERHREGLVLGGTSAGASIMSCTMLINGDGGAPSALERVGLSPGLKFMEGPIIDQHFAERGRVNRLLAAVAQQPAKLGVGIDEDTAMVVEGDRFRVLGSGAVTVLDAKNLSYTNLESSENQGNYALFGVALHIVPPGCGFSLADRVPLTPEEVAGDGADATKGRSRVGKRGRG
jgi:cyanophycinase